MQNNSTQYSRKLPRVLSLKLAKAPRNSVLLYANVQSVSRPTRVIHLVTAIQVNRSQRFRCSCEHASFARCLFHLHGSG